MSFHATQSASRVFNELVHHNNDICSNCFRRTHTRYTNTHKINVDRHGNVRYVPIKPETRRESTDETIRDVEPVEYAARYHEKTICKCGVFKHTTRVRPLDKDTFMERAHRLRAALESQSGVELDADIFYSRLRKLKSNPDHQFVDDHIYESAVFAAINKHGQEENQRVAGLSGD